MINLTDDERALLDIFGKVWPKPGPKADAIKAATGLTPTAATQLVNRLIDTEAALAYAPLTTKRLLRLRESRRRGRSVANTTLGRTREILRTNP